jgi:hypothetical protein
MSIRIIRVLQVFMASIFLFIAWALARHGNGASIMPALFGILPIIVFEYQIRGIRKAGEKVKASIAACAKSVFEASATIREGYDIDATTTMAAFNPLMREPNNGAAFTTEGKFRGARVSVASHVSLVGRQFGEFHHTYSHVLVDVLGLEKSFRITRERAGTKLSKAIGVTKDVSVGDKAFDDMFVVEADDDLARAVLDDSIRERIMQVQSKVGNVSNDLGAVGGMNILLTNRGLALRWPGAIDPRLARLFRDLLIDMRERMLSFENRKAARVAENATGYRVSADEPSAAPAGEEAEVVGARNRV